MAKAIHFQQPNSLYHSCGMGDRASIAMTPDIEQVTCGRCLQTVAGKKRRGRPTHGKEAKKKLTLRIDPELKQKAENEGLNISVFLEDQLRQRYS